MCVQCFYGEGILIVHDCRSTIVALGIVTLYHLLGVEGWGAAKQFYLLVMALPGTSLIQFAFRSIPVALYCKLIFEALSELQFAYTYSLDLLGLKSHTHYTVVR